MGSDPDKLYPYTIFEEHLKKYWYWGLEIASVLIKVLLAEKEERPDFVNSIESGRSLLDVLHDTPVRTECNRRLRNIVRNLIDNDLL